MRVNRTGCRPNPKFLAKLAAEAACNRSSCSRWEPGQDCTLHVDRCSPRLGSAARLTTGRVPLAVGVGIEPLALVQMAWNLHRQRAAAAYFAYWIWLDDCRYLPAWSVCAREHSSYDSCRPRTDRRCYRNHDTCRHEPGNTGSHRTASHRRRPYAPDVRFGHVGFVC